MRGESTIVAKKDQVSAQVAGEFVILSLKTGLYHGLNPIGSRVWELIRQPTTFRAICETILAEYDVDTETCERDLEDLLKQLEEVDLIEIRDGSFV
jgi:hypothetical protein